MPFDLNSLQQVLKSNPESLDFIKDLVSDVHQEITGEAPSEDDLEDVSLTVLQGKGSMGIGETIFLGVIASIIANMITDIVKAHSSDISTKAISDSAEASVMQKKDVLPSDVDVTELGIVLKKSALDRRLDKWEGVMESLASGESLQ